MTVLIIPVAIGVPPVLVFVPPPVIRTPAIFTSLSQLVARVVGLPAVPTVMLHSFVQPVVSLGQPMLALGLIRAHASGAGEQKERCKRSASQNELCELHDSHAMFSMHPALLLFSN
jgi:hypothetical protein